MKIIVYEWNQLNDSIAEENFKRLGYEVEVFSRKINHYTKDLDFASEMINRIHTSVIDAVFSFNYFPIISSVCNTVGIPYYSLVYDCPHLTLFSKTIYHDCNHVGCFDRSLVKRFRRMGINSVSYIPIPVDVNYFSCKGSDYISDVSFVGSMYTDEHSYYDKLKVTPIEKARMDSAVNEEVFNYYAKDIELFFRDENDNIDEALINYYEQLLRAEDLLPGDEYIEDVEYIFQSIVLRKQVTILEREKLISKLSLMDNDFKLYSASKIDNPDINRVLMGVVDYKNQMPLVFKNSKVNINITLRSIQTGIPLRVLDILGCGGFCLSNYQRELEEELRLDEEIVVYKSYEECIDKLNYYLKHDDARSKIALAGKSAVADRFNYASILGRLMNI